VGEAALTSAQYVSLANVENTGKAYRDFVKKLIQRVSVAHPLVELVSGKPAFE